MTRNQLGLPDSYMQDERDVMLTPEECLSPVESTEPNDRSSRSPVPGNRSADSSEPKRKGRKSAEHDGTDSPGTRQISVASCPGSGSSKRRSSKKRVPRNPDDEIINLDDDGRGSSRTVSRRSGSRGSRGSGSRGSGSSLRSSSIISNHDDDMDYFCADHMELVTNRVLREDHSDCQHIVPVEEWAEAQKMERERQGTETLLKKIDVFAGLMIEERTDMKTALCQSKNVVMDEFLDLVEDLVTELLKKQKDFTQKLEEVHETNVKNINGQIKRCTMIQKETSSCLTQLETCSPNSEQFKAIKRKVQEKCPIYEEILRRDFNASIRLDYEFVPNQTTEALFNDVETLGEINIKPTPSKLPAFMTTSNVSDFAKRTIGKSEWIDARDSQDGQGCCMTGCAFLPNGRLVVADWSNTCLKMVNLNGSVVSRLLLPNNPWDVNIIDDSNVAVTVPGEKRIFIIEYTNTDLKEITSFETEGESWGIVSFADKFAVTCDPWSKSPSVKVYKNTGKLVSFFQKDVRGDMLFKYPEHIATDSVHKTLYVSDSRAHKVIAITTSGRNVFQYSHDKLVYPAGLVSDSQGNIYVCGKDSNNVHQISKSGALIQIILENDDVENPRSISFEPSGENMMLTDTGPKFFDEIMLAKLR